MAGDVDHARLVCREYCDSVGLCVTVSPADYVYTGGMEPGFVVGLIAYPRFCPDPDETTSHAFRLGDLLRSALGQSSYSVQTPETTFWRSWREEDRPHG